MLSNISKNCGLFRLAAICRMPSERTPFHQLVVRLVAITSSCRVFLDATPASVAIFKKAAEFGSSLACSSRFRATINQVLYHTRALRRSSFQSLSLFR